MKLLILTKEYPPHIYGGAGVHVDYLSKELAKRISVEVRCFGDQQEKQGDLSIQGYGFNMPLLDCSPSLRASLGSAKTGVEMNAVAIQADLVHCHTWHTYMGGIMAKLLYGIPLVITVHSLEPLRPWKREQLGRGYDYSLWVEKTALEMADRVIAVSADTKRDIQALFPIPEQRISVIHNGVDSEAYCVSQDPILLKQLGIDTQQPYILFVGRISHQKGIMHLLQAIKALDLGFQVVLYAEAPDTSELEAQVEVAVQEVQKHRQGVIWIRHMTQRQHVIALYSGASLFVCPSIYEPFGIINLEAMACGVPVVASAIGGIKEVVVDGVTGFLVPFEQMADSPFHALYPQQYAQDFADRINQLMADPALRKTMGAAGRHRVKHHFSWQRMAEQTMQLYTDLLQS